MTIGLKIMLAYKFLPPPRIANAKLNKYKDSDKLEIHATITVHNLQHFDPMQHAFDMEFTLDLEWFDSRLRFNNLKYKPKVNAMLPDEVDHIWFPYFTFFNTEHRDVGVVDEKAVFHVLKKEKGHLSDYNVLENKYVFKGKENYIEYQRFYAKHLNCHYKLQWYPFDTQVCHLEIIPFADLKDFIVFVTEDFKYEGDMNLREFTIRRIGMRIVDRQMLEVDIVIQRRLLSLVLTTFAPTLILNVIGHMSNYFKDSMFEGLMALNVTVVLVLTTMFLR